MPNFEVILVSMIGSSSSSMCQSEWQESFVPSDAVADLTWRGIPASWTRRYQLSSNSLSLRFSLRETTGDPSTQSELTPKQWVFVRLVKFIN